MSGIFGSASSAITSLTDLPNNSLGYEVEVIENHLHSPNKCLGYSAAAPAAGGANSVVAFALTGGNGAFGTEIQVHDGTVIESGSTTKKFDIGKINIPTVGTANRNTLFEIHYGSVGTAVPATITDVGDVFTKVAHGLLNGQQVMLDTIVTTTGIDTVTAYYIINKTNDTFQLSLTSGGAAVVVTTNGTCNYKLITKSLLATGYVCSATTTPQQLEVPFQCFRITCNNRLWIRAWSAGGTNALGVLFNYHTYSA